MGADRKVTAKLCSTQFPKEGTTPATASSTRASRISVEMRFEVRTSKMEKRCWKTEDVGDERHGNNRRGKLDPRGGKHASSTGPCEKIADIGGTPSTSMMGSKRVFCCRMST